MSRRMMTALGLALCAIAVVVYLRARDQPSDASRPTNRGGAGSPSQTPSEIESSTKPPQHVTKLATAEERKRIADRIATAQAVRARARATAPPSLPESDSHGGTIGGIPMHLQDALQEAIPFLADCYAKSPGSAASTHPAVMMTLTGDPDIGTLIDADQMLDQDGKPLAHELDECLRGTLSSLELPPLGEGDKIKVQYSFNLGDK